MSAGLSPGVVGADHGAPQPDSAVAVQADEAHHATAATTSTATGMAAAVGAVVAVSVTVAAVAMVAAAVIDAGQPNAARRGGLEVYADSAYGTGAARAAYQRDGTTP